MRESFFTRFAIASIAVVVAGAIWLGTWVALMSAMESSKMPVHVSLFSPGDYSGGLMFGLLCILFYELNSKFYKKYCSNREE